jgi:hypothetical protein
MRTKVEHKMCNLMPVLLLFAVSEPNHYLHWRLSWAKSSRIYTTVVATHTFQKDPETFFPIGAIFHFSDSKIPT